MSVCVYIVLFRPVATQSAFLKLVPRTPIPFSDAFLHTTSFRSCVCVMQVLRGGGLLLYICRTVSTQGRPHWEDSRRCFVEGILSGNLTRLHLKRALIWSGMPQISLSVSYMAGR